MTTTYSRRRVLRDIGLGAALAPFLPLLDREREALAAAPRRLAWLWFGNGPVLDAWSPTGTETAFTLSPILKPFEAHRPKMIVLGGVNKVPGGAGGATDELTALLKQPGHVVDLNPHVNGCYSSLTAELCATGTLASAVGDGQNRGWPPATSVDQVVAQRLGSKSIQLGVFQMRNNPTSRLSYKAAGVPLTPETSPYKFFDSIFGDLGLSQPERDRLRAERKSIIDYVRGELPRVRAKVGAADWQKIDQHLSAVAELEKNLLAAPDPSCARPASLMGTPVDVYDSKMAHITLKAQLDLIVLAYACNLAPIATLQFDQALGTYTADWPGVDISQGVPSDDPNETYVTPNLHGIGHRVLDGNPTYRQQARDKIIKHDTWISEQVAYFLDELGKRNLMDDTLVVYDRELSGTAYHATKANPYVLFQGTNGYFKTAPNGRWLTYKGYDTCQGPYWGTGFEPHAKLLTSVCHWFGLTDVTSFGNARMLEVFQGQGPLPRLTG